MPVPWSQDAGVLGGSGAAGVQVQVRVLECEATRSVLEGSLDQLGHEVPRGWNLGRSEEGPGCKLLGDVLGCPRAEHLGASPWCRLPGVSGVLWNKSWGA